MIGTFLTIQQLVGFIIVVLSILIISYEKDKFEIEKNKIIWYLYSISSDYFK